VTAGGRNPLRSGGGDLFHFGSGIAALVLDDPDARLFAGQGERHKNRFAFHASQECAAVNRLLDSDQMGWYSLARLGPRLGVLTICGLGSARPHCWLM